MMNYVNTGLSQARAIVEGAIKTPERPNIDTTAMTPLQRLADHRLVYLASPYSKYEYGIDEAAHQVARIAGHLIKNGVTAYSPIAHTHAIALAANIDPLDHSIWLPFDEIMMAYCDAMCIALMDGWQDSIGVRYEIEQFRGKRWDPKNPPIGIKPVYYIDPMSYEVF
jgi:hypothetical protein